LKPDARYFATLADYWAFGNVPARNSGARLSGTILPGYYFYNYNNPGDGSFYDTGKFNLNALLLNAGLEFKYEKPVNLYWQNSIDVNGFFGIVEGKFNDKTNSAESKLRVPNLQLSFFHTIGFYPNTRTDMRFSYGVQYAQFFDKTNTDKKIIGLEGNGIKASADLSVNYYISPKFRLNIRSSFYYIWQDSDDEVTINFYDLYGGNYLISYFVSGIKGYSTNYSERVLLNSFRISLLYSIF